MSASIEPLPLSTKIISETSNNSAEISYNFVDKKYRIIVEDKKIELNEIQFRKFLSNGLEIITKKKNMLGED